AGWQERDLRRPALRGDERQSPLARSSSDPVSVALGRCSTVPPERTWRAEKSVERTFSPTFTFRPSRVPRGTTDCLPTTVIPVFMQPCEIRLRCTWAVGPTLAGARSSDRVWISHSLSYRSSSGLSSRSARLASQNDWIVPTSCQYPSNR